MQEGTADSPKLTWILLFYFSTLFTHPFWTLTFTFKCHYLKNMFSTLGIILMCMVHLAGHDDRKGNQFILFSKAVIKDFRILWDKISQNNFEVHSFIVWETILCNVIYRVFSNLCNSGFFFLLILFKQWRILPPYLERGGKRRDYSLAKLTNNLRGTLYKSIIGSCEIQMLFFSQSRHWKLTHVFFFFRKTLKKSKHA